MIPYRVPYSTTTLEFNLLPGMRGRLVESKRLPPLENVPAAIEAALAEPVNVPPLRDLARPGDTVCIVFTDSTRACPDPVLIPPLLRELEQAGVDNKDITLLCGIGMHRPSTHAEKVARLGQAVVDHYRVIDNEPQNPAALVDLGAVNGIPLSVHRAAYEADVLIATGIVEPHQYAGYSGGRKTVAVGAAGEALIAYSHSPRFIDDPHTRLGQIEGNPFHEAITAAALRAGLRFIINAVLDDDGHVVCVMAGEPVETHRRLVEFARAMYEVAIPQQVDVAIGGVGFPKDVNLYQASRAPSYLHFAPTPVVRPGGYYITPARCQEGAGAGVGEQRFLAAMRDAPDVPSILDEARANGYPPGGQRAFVMAKVLEQCHVIIVGSECPEIVTACKMIPAQTMEEAWRIVVADLGSVLDVLIVPHALLTLPMVKSL
ncbi:MAG TPA: nickel-dependent lactate racemase [Anaerolineae bacterium]|nr:nickel-dependent lactate racemase [Anaerolineae bacterium]